MRYLLWCKEKQCGDSGPMSQVLDGSDPSYAVIPGKYRPEIGNGIRVGSFVGRIFQSQDWWQTTPVVEILIDEPEYMKFRTRNSIYEWRII